MSSAMSDPTPLSRGRSRCHRGPNTILIRRIRSWRRYLRRLGGARVKARRGRFRAGTPIADRTATFPWRKWPTGRHFATDHLESINELVEPLVGDHVRLGLGVTADAPSDQPQLLLWIVAVDPWAGMQHRVALGSDLDERLATSSVVLSDLRVGALR